jgi:neutral ceramidase
MLLKKILKRTLIGLGFFIGALLVFVAFAIAPIDRYDYTHEPFYQTMMKELDTLSHRQEPAHPAGFSVGYARVNLIPTQHTALAGHGQRRGKVFTGVHDTVYVNAMVISNGKTRVALVSADLLIMPPSVNAVLEKELPATGFTLDNTYLSATHTHNSIGNWAGRATSILYGEYSDSIVHFIADRIKLAVVKASQNMAPAQIKAGKFPVGAVRHRIVDEGGLDSLVHIIEIDRSDSTRLLLASYTAHATCITVDDMVVSRDYPGVLTDAFEKRGYNFAMFMAGAVGSHAAFAPEHGWSCTEWVPEQICARFDTSRHVITAIHDTTLAMYRVPLQLGDAQVKISEDWKMRGWVFNAAFGKFPVYLTALRMGNLVLLGTPCDYSGELTPPLYALGKEKGLDVMVTSFNGGYIGYITPDKYYDSDHYETRLMNWYGPGSGSYMTESLKRLIEITAGK